MELAAEGFINRCIGNAPSHICIYMLYSVTKLSRLHYLF